MDKGKAIERAVDWLCKSDGYCRRANSIHHLRVAMEKLWEKAEIHGERNMDRQYRRLCTAKSMSEFRRLVVQLPGPQGPCEHSSLWKDKMGEEIRCDLCKRRYAAE